MMKRLKFSDPMFVGRQMLKSNTMLHLDMPRIELGVVRARERVESLEDARDGCLVERTRTHLWRLNVVFLKLDGTEDDEDDDDQTTQNKLLILVAKDAKTIFHYMNMFDFVLSCVTFVFIILFHFCHFFPHITSFHGFTSVLLFSLFFSKICSALVVSFLPLFYNTFSTTFSHLFDEMFFIFPTFLMNLFSEPLGVAVVSVSGDGPTPLDVGTVDVTVAACSAHGSLALVSRGQLCFLEWLVDPRSQHSRFSPLFVSSLARCRCSGKEGLLWFVARVPRPQRSLRSSRLTRTSRESGGTQLFGIFLFALAGRLLCWRFAVGVFGVAWWHRVSSKPEDIFLREPVHSAASKQECSPEMTPLLTSNQESLDEWLSFCDNGFPVVRAEDLGSSGIAVRATQGGSGPSSLLERRRPAAVVRARYARLVHQDFCYCEPGGTCRARVGPPRTSHGTASRASGFRRQWTPPLASTAP